MTQKIALIGECMLELTRPTGARVGRSLTMNLSYGGDTLNSAIYLARQGIAVDYVTALGDDPMSAWMTEQWRAEGLGCDLVEYQPGGVPGLYLIDTDIHGERSFYYWRDSAPAGRLLEDPTAADTLFSRLAGHAWLCLSGITLAIYSEDARQRLFERLADYRNQGGKVVFDSNYRPGLWSSQQSTRRTYESMYRLTDLALPTQEDEQRLFDDVDQSGILERLQSWGVGEIGLKMGESGCLVSSGGMLELVPANRVMVVDTTAAGDSFNAGYLAARMKGQSAPEAAAAGHQLASVVIQHHGAIIPAEAMP